MGGAVVHFEIMGQDAAKLREFYSELFGWSINADNQWNYGTVDRSENLSSQGIGIGGGVGQMPEGMPGHTTVYVEVPDVEAALDKVQALGGTRLMGPDKVMEGIEIGVAHDPEGHVIGLIKAT
ncbi:MAG TPA: VOC family protein [Streptosporangiaceae bacterium]|nr:VOC family protein [Streptosporangiaceae bacterium]